ncbi:hypothetical protein EB796_011767 [Bugula neritina]|uniref:WSC domain-containing protein n=1 Tax=Bugula neritina TaxID=10212 RepID=A0A7J7JVE3_BUGNE|nr:hypothetical protein EB796_011767 [Bugula neritina]
MRCGAQGKNSVYRTNFLGCYIEDTYVKTFDHFAHLPSYDVTPTDCITKCRKDGFLLAGIRNGQDCYCGNEFNRYGEAPVDECNLPCSGNPQVTCGGILRNSVYNTQFDSKRYK